MRKLSVTLLIIVAVLGIAATATYSLLTISRTGTIWMSNSTDQFWMEKSRDRMYAYNITGESIATGHPVAIGGTFAQLDTCVAFTAIHGTGGTCLTIADSIKMGTGYGNGCRLVAYVSGTATRDTVLIIGYSESNGAQRDTLAFDAALSKTKWTAKTYTKIDSIYFGTCTDHDSVGVYFGSALYPNARNTLLANDSTVFGIATQVSKTRGLFKVATRGYAQALVYADSTTGIVVPGMPLITKVTTGHLTAAVASSATHRSPAMAVEPAYTEGLRWVYLWGSAY